MQGRWGWLSFGRRPAAASGESLSASIAQLSPDERQQAYQQEVSELQNRLTRLEAYLDGFPKPLSDLDALAQSLTTPQAAFEYVRDQIALEPYPGVMKGALGTFLTRGGNDLDRSLLLATLLKQQGHTVKVARGRLPLPQTQSFLQRIADTPDAVEQILRSLPKDLPASKLSDQQREFGKVRVQRAEERGKTRREAVEQNYQLIQSFLRKGGLTVGQDATARQLETLRDHFWVQATINDQQTDLDPSFSKAGMNQKFAEPDETFDPDELPENLFQHIGMRMAGEFLQGGQVTSTELLSKDMRAADLFGKNVRLSLEPESLEGDINQYQPTLVVGEDNTEGKAFQLRPQEGGEESSEAGEESPGGGNAAEGLLGGLGGGEGETPKKAAPRPKATGAVLGRLYLQVVSKAPHLAEAHYRRVIMDRLEVRQGRLQLQAGMEDDKSIRALLIQVWDGAISVGPCHVLYLFKTQLETLKAQESMEEKARAKVYLGQEFSVDDLAGPMLPPELINYFFSSDLARFLIRQKSAPRARQYYEQPRLAFFRHGFAVRDWSKPARSRRFQEGIDLRNAPFQFAAGGDQALPLALKAGIADTALESSFVHGGPGFNALPLFAAATEQGIPLVTIGPAQRAGIDSLALPPAIKDVLQHELSQGHMLILPTRLVSLNQTQTFDWWSIDPATGTALGKMELGGAQAMVETSKLEEQVRKLAKIFGKFYGGLLSCYMLAIADTLAPPSGPYTILDEKDLPVIKGGGDLGECVIGVTCTAISDLSSEAVSSAGFSDEAQKLIAELQELIAEWAATKLYGPEMGKACKEAM